MIGPRGPIAALGSLCAILCAKRRARLRWIVAFPGVIALLLIGHAFEDAGPIGAAPYLLIIVISGSYLVRPMLISWLPLFAAFSWYAVAVAATPEHGPPGEWVFFMLLGLIPTLLLWLARPRGRVVGANSDPDRAQQASDREA
jgi:hypothetical protein